MIIYIIIKKIKIMMKSMSKTNKIIAIVIGLVILAWGIVYKNFWGLLGIIPVALAFIPGGGESKKEGAAHPEAPKVPGMEMKEEPKMEEKTMSEESETPKMSDEPMEEAGEKMPEMNIPDEEKEHTHV